MAGEIESKRKIVAYTDLVVWQEARKLAKLVYEIRTNDKNTKTVIRFNQDE